MELAAAQQYQTHERKREREEEREREELFGQILWCVACQCQRHLMKSMRMFRAENAAMLDAAIQRMEGAIDARMTGYENRISKEVSDLQRRAEQLELRKKARADENNDPAVQEAKRRRRSLSVETGSDTYGVDCS